MSLILNFGQVEAEILGLEHTRGHFQFFTFLHEDMRNYPVSTVLITLIDSQNLNMTSHITFSNIFHTNNPLLFKKMDFKKSLLKLHRKIT